MGRITDWLMGRDIQVALEPKKRSTQPLDFDTWANWFSYNGLGYPFFQQTLPGTPTDEIGGDYRGLIEGAYKANGVIFSCMLVRQMVFSEARFAFRELEDGRPGDLTYRPTTYLEQLRKPWPGGTTGDLLARMLQDADLAGNAFVTPVGAGMNRRLQRLRPDWMTIVMGSKMAPQHPSGALDMELVGYAYQPGGPGSGLDPIPLLAEQVAHFAPIPDPAANFRGMSWLTPVVREIMADQAATSHKLQFFENGATPNTVVSLDPAIDAESFNKWIEAFDERLTNPYETLYLGGGASVEVVGTDLQKLDFKNVQGAGETRIAAAANVPPVIVGLSEGLQAATYSNYAQARRRFADGTMRPLWRNAAGSLAQITRVPENAELWYDDRDVPFLQDDLKDRADIQQTQAVALKALIDAGFEPDSAVTAVQADDFSRLKHSGLTSVQLLPPGQSKNGSSNNGSGDVPDPAPMGEGGSNGNGG